MMVNLPPTFALGIFNLPMLGWLVMAAAPILIHLWSRRRHREMRWAAMEYLLKAIRRRHQRLRFEQWLLLAIRTLVVVLVVLAVAEPFVDRGATTWIGGGRTHRVLVLDGSYSMGYKPGDQSRFEAARQAARRIVEGSPQGDAFSLILMASPPRVVVGAPSLAPGEVIQEIDTAQIAQTSFDLPATVALVARQIERARRELPRIERHEVFFLSDLGRVGWAPELSSAAQAEFRLKSMELADEAAIVLLDFGQPSAENLAVTGLAALEPFATPSQDAGVLATVKNFGRQSVSRQTVELLVGGRRVGRQTVDIAAGGEAAAQFACRFEAPGDHAVEVRAEGDALPLDNRRWLAVPVKGALRALVIDGRPSGEPFRGAADYLTAALAPRARQGAAVEVEQATETALLERELSRYDVVFLCDVARFTDSETRVLDAYLQGGGNLVVFLGAEVEAERYNQELGGGQRLPRILPARLQRVVKEPQYGLDAREFRHPIVRAFRGKGAASLLTMPVFEYYKVALPKDSKARVALAVANGDPLLIEEPIRRGRVILVTTSADVSWTAMPLWPGFVPLMHEIVAFCAAGQDRYRNVLVGEELVAAVAVPAGAAAVTVKVPDGRSRAAQPGAEGEGRVWNCGEATQSGIYTVRFGPSADQKLLLAANLDTRESDLTQIAMSELRESVWPGVAFEYVPPMQDYGFQTAGAPALRSSRVSIEILCVVVGLLLLETLLAWRFGYHGS